jgi:hypothetical protein
MGWRLKLRLMGLQPSVPLRGRELWKSQLQLRIPYATRPPVCDRRGKRGGSVAGCDNGPQPSPTAIPARAPTALFADTPSAVPANPAPIVKEAVCTTPEVTGKLNLLTLPGILDEPVAMAMLKARIYVAGKTSNTIGVIENSQLTKVIPTGPGQRALIADEVLGKLFVLHGDGTMLSMLDGDGVQATIPITNPAKGSFQHALRMVGDPANHLAYIGINTETPDPEVVIVDLRSFTVSTRVPLPAQNGIDQLAIDSVNRQLLVRNFDARSPSSVHQPARPARSKLDRLAQAAWRRWRKFPAI